MVCNKVQRIDTAAFHIGTDKMEQRSGDALTAPVLFDINGADIGRRENSASGIRPCWTDRPPAECAIWSETTGLPIASAQGGR